MNRAFLIILLPAALAALAYTLVAVRLGVQLSLARLLCAIGVLVLAVAIVHLLRRRRTRSRSS